MIQQQMNILDMLNEEKQYVRRIVAMDAIPFLLNVHYARRIPCITDAFGLFVDGRLIGVVTYGIPASNNLCFGLAGEENKSHVLELNRLVILPEFNGKNYASYLVSHSLRMLERGLMSWWQMVSIQDILKDLTKISVKQEAENIGIFIW